MQIYRVDEPRLGALRIREWKRRTRGALGLLLLILVAVAAGLALLDQSSAPLSEKVFNGVWDGLNLVTTLGAFSDFNPRQKVFMLIAMFAATLVVGLAISTLTGLLSGDDVMAYRENRAMEHKLEHLSDHVVIVGFRALGDAVGERLRAAGQTVLVAVSEQGEADQASDRGHLVLLGSADMFDNVLKRARLETARALIVTTSDGNDNLAITLLAHTLNPSLPIAVPGENDFRKSLLVNAGATEVVIADELLAGALVDMLVPAWG